MDVDEYHVLFEAMGTLEAQEMLEHLMVSLYPEMDKEARGKIHKSYHKKAYPDVWKEKKKASLEDIARALSGR